MSFMFEVYYKPPADPAKDEGITKVVSRLGGSLSFKELSCARDTGAVCLTYEFDELDSARRAADSLRLRGEHVEGPMDYGE
jgi:hypothetical protein